MYDEMIKAGIGMLDIPDEHKIREGELKSHESNYFYDDWKDNERIIYNED